MSSTGKKKVPRRRAKCEVSVGESLPSVSKEKDVDSEMSSTEVVVDSGKRPKMSSPLTLREAVAAASSAVVNDGADGRANLPVVRENMELVADKVASEAASASGVGAKIGCAAVLGSDDSSPVELVGNKVGEFKAITAGLTDLLFDDSVPKYLAKRVLSYSGQYETLLFGLIAENERLKGRIDVFERTASSAVPFRGLQGSLCPDKGQIAPEAANLAVSTAGCLAPPAPVVTAVPKPVETWTVVVKGKGATTSQDVVDKVVGQVAPTLGVRVHEVLPTRDGGAVIRTRSDAERRKIMENGRFEEVGLKVAVREKLGPKIVVRRVYADITQDEFMEEMFTLNFAEEMSRKSFMKKVRMLSSPWGTDSGQLVNVILECTEQIAERLKSNGVYIKWFRYAVRDVDVIATCHRCYSFDHRVRDCRIEEVVCRRCGDMGHTALQCTNEVNCRDCAFKRQPAGHAMLSMDCPIYATKVARVNARH